MLAAARVAAAFQGGFGMIEPPAPTPLPAPSLVDRYLLENPWPLSTILALGAIAAFVTMRHRVPVRRVAAAATALLFAAAGVLLLAASVETPRESLRGATRALVNAAASADAARVAGLLAPDATLFPSGGGSPLGRDAILARVRDDLGGRWKLREWAVLETQAAATGDSGRTQVKVRVTPEAFGFPNISWWRLAWSRDATGAWRAISIEPVSVTPEVGRELR